jgi:hypothetical protein
VASPRSLDVAAILAAVYRRPNAELELVAERVRARLALIETVAECMRLLVEAPASAFSATIGTTQHEEEGQDAARE